MNYVIVKTDELYHHGILGQRWGVRRFQNPDGTLTEAGKKRYSKEIEKRYLDENSINGRYIGSYRKNRIDVKNQIQRDWQNSKEYKNQMDLDRKLAEKGDLVSEQEVRKLIELENISDDKRRKIQESYVDKYAEALIKDINLPVTKSAIEYIKTLETFYSM